MRIDGVRTAQGVMSLASRMPNLKRKGLGPDQGHCVCRSAGFTLLEVMVASAILSLVLAALYGVFSRTLASKQLAEERATRARVARITLLRIGEDLQASFPVTPGNAGFTGETFSGGVLPEGTLSFVSAVHALFMPAGDTGDLCRIGYTLVPDPTVPARRQLVRRVNLDVHADPDAAGDIYPLLSQVRGWRVRFFDGRSWLEEWGEGKTRGKLPRAVEVALYLDGPGEEVMEFSSVIDLPLANARGFGAS